MEFITRNSALHGNENTMNILLTFAGVRDPFNAEMVQGSYTDDNSLENVFFEGDPAAWSGAM
jgi:hypothetical protein